MFFLFSRAISVLSSPLLTPPYAISPMIHVVVKYRWLFLVCLTVKDGSIQRLEMSATAHPMICNIPEDLNTYHRLLTITHYIFTSLCLSLIIIHTTVSLCSQYVSTIPSKLIYILSLISSTLNVLQTLASLIFSLKFFHTFFRFLPHIIDAAYKLLQTSHFLKSPPVCLLLATIPTTVL